MPIISKKNLIFLIFGTVKIKNPRAVGKNRQILDQNIVVGGSVAERLVSTLAYGWVERCSNVAGCETSSL